MAPMEPELRPVLRRVFRYLVAHWPPSRPVRLEFRRIGDRHDALAFVEKVKGGRLRLVIDSRASFGFALSLLQHEHAHAVAWDVREPHHGPAWQGVFAAICEAFEDGDAFEDSKSW